MKKLKVVVLTQEDSFFIPLNIKKLSEVACIKEIVVLDTKGSLANKTGNFFLWFGLLQFIKMGIMVAYRYFLDIMDRLFFYKVLHGEGSIKTMARKEGIPYSVLKNVNSPEFLEHIKQLEIDLIVSYSCPVVIKPPLLSYPEYGIINVHGSYLPEFQGLLPSFWHLYHQSEFGGATVHYMSEKIDDGDIIVQERIDLKNCKTMFELMQRTKKTGGELMVKAVLLLAEGKVIPVKNETSNGSYYSWPSKEQAYEFRKNGGKLI